MSTSRKNISVYKDIDLEFSKNSLTNDLKIRNGYSSIAQSIRNILLTFPGERPFSDFGGGISEFITEPSSLEYIILLKDKVFNLLSLYEPRISVTFNDVTIERLSDSSIKINIKYKLSDSLGDDNYQEISITVTGD